MYKNLIIFKTLIMEILSGTELFTNGSSLTRKMMDLCGLFSRIFPITVITLFCPVLPHCFNCIYALEKHLVLV